MSSSELSVIKQKSIKLDLELEKAEENTREINLEIRRQRTILEQMDSKIHKKQQEHENEEKGLETEHEALISKLKVSVFFNNFWTIYFNESSEYCFK